MKITMISTRRGSEDGFTTKQYIKGESYDVSRNMGSMFLRNCWAYNNEQIIEEENILKYFYPSPTRDTVTTNPATRPQQFAEFE